MVYDYNRSVCRNREDYSESGSTEESRLSRFFIDYHSHSEQLVDALKAWGERLRFTTCKYEEGQLHLDCQKPIQSMNSGFMPYMKKHLEKEDKYQPMLKSVSEIEQDHIQLCEKIQDIMISYSPISIRPSFQKIILDKIQSGCPTLTKSVDYYLQGNNIFLYVYVFRTIFETVEAKESSIVLSEKTQNNNKSLLWYGNQRLALGQGDATSIKKLCDIIKELVRDNDIKKRVEEYTKYYKELVMDDRINGLRVQIEQLLAYIHGGGYLGGIDACELCNPPKPMFISGKP